MPRLNQASFARGELGPDLYGRTDISAYIISLKTALNVIVKAYGGVTSRFGLKFLAPAKTHSGTPPRLIEFKYNTTDTYILEFGEQYMRVIRNDVQILNAAVSISSITRSTNPVIETTSPHGFSAGQTLYLSGISGMTQLNGRWVQVSNPGSTTFDLYDILTGQPLDTSSYDFYTSGGSAASVYEIATPYALEDVANLKKAQSANVMTLTHNGYDVRELTRTDHDAWTLSTVTFAPEQAAPTSVSVTADTAGSVTTEYQVTALNSETDEESLPDSDSIANGAATPDNTITWSAASGAGRYSVYRKENGVYGWLGDTEELTFKDDNIEPDLTLTPPKARNPFSGSNAKPQAVSFYQQRRVFGSTLDNPDTAYYSVTGSQSNMSQSTPRQADDAITATLNSLEVNDIRAFVPLNDLLIFTSGAEWRANSGDDVAFSAENLRQKPQSSWGISMVDPLVVGDKVVFPVANNRYVRSIGYEITVDGYKGNDMTVFAPHIFQNYGLVQWALAKWPDPLIMCVREDGMAAAFTFNPEQEIVAWTRWQTKGKFKTVAATRPSASEVDDAHYFVVQRTIGGNSAYYIERTVPQRVSTIEDYFLVDSGLSLNAPVAVTGVTSASPVVMTAAAHGFSNGDEVDPSLIEWQTTLDDNFSEVVPDDLNGGRYFVADQTTNTFALVETEGRKDITGIDLNDPVRLTVTGHDFTDGQKVGVFNVSGTTELNGRTFTVAAATADTFELLGEDGTSHTAYVSGGTVYPAVDGSAFSAYVEGGEVRKTFTTISGLWHIEGEEVVILADGNVVDDKTVTNGAVTLDTKASRAHVGLRYVCDIETLDPEQSDGGGTIQGEPQRVTEVTIRLKDSRGVLVGPDAASLSYGKERQNETYGQPTQLFTGLRDIEIASDWDAGGRVFIRQSDPVPMTVLAIIPDLDIGDDDDS